MNSTLDIEHFYLSKMHDLHLAETALLDLLHEMEHAPKKQQPKAWDSYLPKAKEQTGILRRTFRELAHCFGGNKVEVKNLVMIVSAAPEEETEILVDDTIDHQSQKNAEDIACFQCLKTYASLLNYHSVVSFLQQRIALLRADSHELALAE